MLAMLHTPMLMLLPLLMLTQESIDGNRPPGAKGTYWKGMYVCSTMGPSLKINLSGLQAMKSKTA